MMMPPLLPAYYPDLNDSFKQEVGPGWIFQGRINR